MKARKKMFAFLLLVTCAISIKTAFWHYSAEINISYKPKVLCPAYDRHCIRFQRLLENWPIVKPKAAIYFLIQKQRIFDLENALKSLDKQFNKIYKYPIIIFHEEDSISILHKVRRMSKSALFFQQVNFTLPDFLTKPVPQKMKCNGKHTIGYRHMCRFQSMMLYKEPIMPGLEFYWRLDDDSLLLRQVNYDVFTYMNKHELDYGYVLAVNDSETCTVELWDTARTYVKNKKIKTQFFEQLPENKIFFNNFEIARMSFWLSQQYQEYIDYIDKKGGIYYHRWGDAPIKTIALSMFVPENRTHHFKDIGYKHGTYHNP